MNELYNEGRRNGIGGTVDWARLGAEARKMIESGLELVDRVEKVWDVNVFQTPGRRAGSIRFGR